MNRASLSSPDSSELPAFESGLHSKSREASSASPSLIIFDLDDTLFRERDYLCAAYMAIGTLDSPSPEDSVAAHHWLCDTFARSGRAELFERYVEAMPDRRITLTQWLHAMRTAQVPGGLPLRGWARRFLAERTSMLAVLTNGNPEQQRNKFRQLDPREIVDHMSFYAAAEIQAKPSPKGVLTILRDLDVAPTDALFVGDDDIDFACAQGAGVPFLRIDKPVRAGHLHCDEGGSGRSSAGGVHQGTHSGARTAHGRR